MTHPPTHMAGGERPPRPPVGKPWAEKYPAPAGFLAQDLPEYLPKLSLIGERANRERDTLLALLYLRRNYHPCLPPNRHRHRHMERPRHTTSSPPLPHHQLGPRTGRRRIY